jgi:LPS sulfotransferase NodH
MASGRHEARFVIFSAGRSGSTLLVGLLDQLPDVHCDDEILHDRVLAPRLFIRGRQARAGGRAYGFKLLTYQVRKVQRIADAGDFLRYLDRRGYRIIYLRRENLLRHALSNLHARHRGSFHHDRADGTPEMAPMTVDLGQLLHWLRGRQRSARYEERALSGLDFLDVVYERDLQPAESHQATADRVAEFVGVPSAPVRATLTRLTTDDVTDFVTNHEEVARFVAGTEFRRYLS